MALIQKIIPQSKYDLKCPYALKPIGICVHNTANDASAANEVAYMTNNNSCTSFHIAVDDKEAIQCLPFNRNAWASGDGANGKGNRNYIHVEICYSKSGGPRFIEAEKRAAKEIAALMKIYGFTISNIKRHKDFSNKYCPHRTMDMGWDRFLKMIQSELDVLNSASQKQVSSDNGEYLYKVIAGTFSTVDNANRHKDALKKAGFDAYVTKVKK